MQVAIKDLTAKLELAGKHATLAHGHSESYYLQALDLPNTHIAPAKAYVKALKGNIVGEKISLNQLLNTARSDRAKAQKHFNRVTKDHGSRAYYQYYTTARLVHCQLASCFSVVFTQP